MSMPIIMPVYVQGQTSISVAEQKCYLLHEGNNQAISDCLDMFQHNQNVGIAGVCTVAIILVVALLFWSARS